MNTAKRMKYVVKNVIKIKAFLKQYVIEIEFVGSRYSFLGREIINIKNDT